MSQPTDAKPLHFETIAIVGVGLIGGSIALAVKERGVARTVIGVGRNPARLDEALQRELIDEAFVNLAIVARRADLTIFCTPVDRIIAGVREGARTAKEGSLITDAGSVKGSICRALEVGLPQRVEFVGSHPLAGSEKQGFEHADQQLFENRFCVMTPVETTSTKALATIREFWKTLGSTVIEMSPEMHDRTLAETSHLPHLVAAALATTLSPENEPLAATGFRDTTRIAAGDVDLWAAIFMGNRDPMLASLSRYEETLAHFRRAIEQYDASALKLLLKAAKMRRDRLAPG
jgi:prephenate dehydrogenase